MTKTKPSFWFWFPLFLFSIGLAAPSLLNVMRAPTSFLWMLKILVSEMGHVFAFFSAILTVVFLRQRERPWRMAGLILAVATILYLRPLATAWWTFARPQQENKQNGLIYQWEKLFPFGALTPVKVEEISFSQDTNHNQSFDLYRAAQRRAPLLVVIHGGSWQKGSRRDQPELSHYLAGLGYHVVAVSYRLAPAHVFPAARDDIAAVVRYLFAHQQELQLELTGTVLLGRSAGSQLAIVSALELLKEGIPVRGVVGIYGPADFVWGYENSRPWHIVSGTDTLSKYLGAHLQGHEDLYHEASPYFVVDRPPWSDKKINLPPILLLHGPGDELVAFHHSQVLHEKLSSRGHDIQLIEIPWATHGFDYFFFGPGSIIATAHIERFLQRTLQASTLQEEAKISTPVPQRIVSLSLTSDEILVDVLSRCGGVARIAALSTLVDDPRYSTVVEQAKKIPGRVKTSVEAVAGYRPDLVFISSFNRPGVLDGVRRLGIPVELLDNSSSLKGVAGTVSKIAARVGCGKVGEELAQEYLHTLEEVKKRHLSDKPLLGIQYSPDGYAFAGDTTFAELLALVGVKNIPSEKGLVGWPKLSTEFVQGVDPDVVIALGEPSQKDKFMRMAAGQPGWQGLAAVKNKRFIVLDPAPTMSLSHHLVKVLEPLEAGLRPLR